MYTPDPGVVPHGEPVYCSVCGELAVERRNVSGPRVGSFGWMEGSPLHDVFQCPYHDAAWHVRVEGLLNEHSRQRSAMLAAACLGEAKIVMDREREKRDREHNKTVLTMSLLEAMGWDARGFGCYMIVDPGNETATIEVMLTPFYDDDAASDASRPPAIMGFGVSVLQNEDLVAFPRGDVKTMADYRRLMFFVRTWIGTPVLHPKVPPESHAMLLSTNCRI